MMTMTVHVLFEGMAPLVPHMRFVRMCHMILPVCVNYVVSKIRGAATETVFQCLRLNEKLPIRPTTYIISV